MRWLSWGKKFYRLYGLDRVDRPGAAHRVAGAVPDEVLRGRHATAGRRRPTTGVTMDDIDRLFPFAAALEKEAVEPERWLWLSFTDGSLPAGQKFLGACMVKARGCATAVREARQRGCNPGGDVRVFGLPPHLAPPPEWANRLLTKAESESDELTAAMEAQG